MPPRARRMSTMGAPSRVTTKSSTSIVSACSASGGAISGSDSGHCGSSNGVSLRGRSRRAPRTTIASSRSRRPSKGRSAGSSTMVSASNTISPISQLASSPGTQAGSTWRGRLKWTPRSVSGPEAGPSAACQVSSAPGGSRSTIWCSSTSRPRTVASSQYSSTATSSAMPTTMNALRQASSASRLRRFSRSAAMRRSCSSGGMAWGSAMATGPRRC